MALKSICLVHRNGDVELYGRNVKCTVTFNQRVQMLARKIGVTPTRKFATRCLPNRQQQEVKLLFTSKDKIKGIQRLIHKIETEIYDITKIPSLQKK